MHNEQPRQVKTGGDPRSLPEFMALREEMSKLTHPARPDVDWKQVEALSLSLFEINGVELQTGAWYTLARSHLARVSGLNEGLAILTALLSHQWAQLWPQSAHARAEMINGLLQRVQKLFRTFSLGPADVPALMLAETRLLELKDILKRQELEHACQMNPVMQLIRSALTRLENSPQPEGEPADTTVVPEQDVVITEDAPASRLVYVIQKEPEVGVQVIEAQPVQPKRWPVFLAGACSALVVATVALWGWQYAQRVDEPSRALIASVAPLPQAVPQDQLQALRQAQGIQSGASGWLKRTSSQLNSLASLPPDWTLRYGNSLLAQAQSLWPKNAEVGQMQQQWQQTLAASALPADALTGWHEGMQQLQILSDKLNALDGHKGKYITVSELKSQVFAAIQAFNKTVPVEEQLRMMSVEVEPQTVPAAQKMQIDQHLKQLITRYSTLTENQ